MTPPDRIELYCECGCAQLVSSGRRFVQGHNARGQRSGPEYLENEAGCWIWQGHIGRNGYPLTKRDGRTVQAHRAFYRERVGPIPEGYEVHHECNVPVCVNPAHLRALTVAEHRALRGPNTRTRKDASLSDRQVRQIKNRLAGGESPHAIARDLGLLPNIVYPIHYGITYRHV